MRYSTEDIYLYTGQFDKVSTVSFGYNTKSRELFGQYITGQFIYTPKERQLIQSEIEKEPMPRTDGFVMFSEILKDIPEDRREILRQTGISASDIIEILQFNRIEENKYAKTDLKELPEPLGIKVDYSEDEADDLMLGLNNQRVSNGYRLCPFERERHNATILRKYGHRISKEDFDRLFIDPETGRIFEGINYYNLKEKFLSDQLSEQEKIEWENIIKKRNSERAEILKKELLKSTEKFKELGLNYADSLKRAYYLTVFFEPERLTHNKIPVWWDYERFIHIFLGHVSEVQVGERFEEKSVFQYKLNDIKGLIDIILKQITDEIQEHFEKTHDKPFKRHGEMCVYYEGDYYVIDIAPSGRLMTFYKKKEKATLPNKKGRASN